MSVSRKKAPRRTVVSVERVGTYGGVVYAHTLECGHVDERKRVAPAAQIACTACVLAEQHVERVRRELLAAAAELVDVWADPWDASGSEVASTEVSVASMRSALAARLRVPAEAVDVVFGDEDGVLTVQYAVIMLSAEEIAGYLSGRVDR